MERDDFEACISVAEQAKDLIIRMAGNLQNAMKIISRNKDDEKEFARASVFIEDSETIEALHSLAYTVLTLENGLEWADSLRKIKN